MSVSRNGDSGSMGWEELELQQVQIVDHLNSDQVPVSGKVNYGHDFDPAGGLEREELGELVAIAAHGIFAFVLPDDTKDQTTQGNADHEVELSFDDDATMIGYSSKYQDTVDADGRGAGGTLEIQERFKTDPDVIFYMTPHNFQSFKDAANGAGASGTMHMAHFHRNYRDFLGGGPIADQHDEMFLHVALGEHSVANAEVYQYVNLNLYWDVYEEPARR